MPTHHAFELLKRYGDARIALSESVPETELLADVPGVRPPFRLPDFDEPPRAAAPRLDEDGERLRREVGL